MSKFKFVFYQTPIGSHTTVFRDGVQIPGVHEVNAQYPVGESKRVTLTFLADEVEVDYKHGLPEVP